ncbi:uncharacterized protein DUF4291 [Thermosporothrix hazakensis]|jgi:hypothetical protein|uniref:Uncharacterized protein DUF4291 n=2 Tax=Thermosporothrix TaxID=768650 RepID=A0A326UCD2_THEHA|nr:DUF4291 domain-containing protein [Thermosporothrix hazakensis]PZW34458.1 uncharacterized protein DUF4291 [Thermosporothrix hazakensis]BBH85581.1 hypothetical protein KTC_03320 [Thermosporothrix sp. COM3]GCE45992.1 hypothetical protein KTH_08610 [Thermosporothrix hazakensis]
MQEYEIRADYDARSIVVYQAYSKVIALPALAHHRFVPPFSLHRMTWIKPSFLWLMERSNWGLKSGQEMILAVRITRQGWEEALSQAVLTTYEPRVYHRYDDWEQQFQHASVYVQWDPERTIQGKSLACKSIQVGLSRHIIERYVQNWTLAIDDYTPRVRKIYALLQQGQMRKAKDLLPRERVYPVSASLARRLGMAR